jgi:hypothetical protein
VRFDIFDYFDSFEISQPSKMLVYPNSQGVLRDPAGKCSAAGIDLIQGHHRAAI